MVLWSSSTNPDAVMSRQYQLEDALRDGFPQPEFVVVEWLWAIAGICSRQKSALFVSRCSPERTKRADITSQQPEFVVASRTYQPESVVDNFAIRMVSDLCLSKGALRREKKLFFSRMPVDNSRNLQSTQLKSVVVVAGICSRYSRNLQSYSRNLQSLTRCRPRKQRPPAMLKTSFKNKL